MTRSDPATVMGSNLLSYFVEMDRAAISLMLSAPNWDQAGSRRIMRRRRRGAAGERRRPCAGRRRPDLAPIITIISDLTEILAAQASTMAALRYARHLIEAILDPLITIDTHGKITDVNHAGSWSPERSIRQNWSAPNFADYFTEPERRA